MDLNIAPEMKDSIHVIEKLSVRHLPKTKEPRRRLIIIETTSQTVSKALLSNLSDTVIGYTKHLPYRLHYPEASVGASELRTNV